MSKPASETLSVVVERELPYPPDKIWRALTQPHLIEEWLMKNDFQPVVDHRFNLRADWGAVACQVLAVEPNKTLAYTWAAYGLESVVTWTLIPHGHRDPPANGAVWLPAGSAAGLPGRQGRLAEVFRRPRAGIGADRVRS
jgi:Activator of Hsp90 ATPase homolog 1-like protein